MAKISRWIEACYSVQAELLWGSSVILSCKGFHQGDPVAGIGCTVTLQPVALRIQEEVPDLRVQAWFQDDGNLMGPKSGLTRAISIIKEDGPPRGLHLRPDKSKVWHPSDRSEDLHPLGPDITRVLGSGIKVLGSPIGDVSYSQGFVAAKVDQMEELLDNLHSLEDPHSEYALLRSCFSLPKFSYITRTIPSSSHLQTYKKFDKAVRHTLEGIIGSPLTDSQWTQASLPVSMGGLGLRCAEVHAPGAYLMSVTSSDQIIRDITGPREEVVSPSLSIHVPEALRLFNSRVEEPLSVQDIELSRQ